MSHLPFLSCPAPSAHCAAVFSLAASEDRLRVCGVLCLFARFTFLLYHLLFNKYLCVWLKGFCVCVCVCLCLCLCVFRLPLLRSPEPPPLLIVCCLC